MSVARILSRAQLGLEAPLVQVEVHLGGGLPGFTIVGLPAPVVRESRERVRAALLNSGYEFPSAPHHGQSRPSRASQARRTLRPADSAGAADRQRTAGRTAAGEPFECYGELGLARGAQAGTAACSWRRCRRASAGHALIVPAANAEEVALSGHAEAFAAANLRARRAAA